jgi:hypothetical protein
VPLPSYTNQHLAPATWAVLQPWYDALNDTPNRQLIRRNIDRECDRTDIDHQNWRDFLTAIAKSYSAGKDPCKTVDSVIKSAPGYFKPGVPPQFLLGGNPLPFLGDSQSVFRLMRLDQFEEHMLPPRLAISASPLTPLADDINSGRITGAHLDGQNFGRDGFPIWCTLSRPPFWRTTADRARDRFGLKHIDDGHLVEMEYPIGMLRNAGVALKPPTVLDSWAGGATNWIFAKRHGAGGPDWGYTVDMAGGGACARGSTEAVHSDFQIQAGQGHHIGLKVYGPLAESSPSINYRKLLSNVGV